MYENKCSRAHTEYHDAAPCWKLVEGYDAAEKISTRVVSSFGKAGMCTDAQKASTKVASCINFLLGCHKRRQALPVCP
jgi:hypothetical protein